MPTSPLYIEIERTLAYGVLALLVEQPKYDILIHSVYHDGPTVERIKTVSPQFYCMHLKNSSSSASIRSYLDNTSTGVIVILNDTYELNAVCQTDLIYIFKRQFPIVFVMRSQKFRPKTVWLSVVWNAFITQKVFFDSRDFEEKLSEALSNAQWNLSAKSDVERIDPSSPDERSKRFSGAVQEWTIAYSNPARVSLNYRQLIYDPHRMIPNIKLQEIYYKYIRVYSEDQRVLGYFKSAVVGNDMRDLIRAYTCAGSFSTTLNRHLATNMLYFFDVMLHENVDYQLVKCLIDFVALCVYRQELSEYLFSGVTYRGMLMIEEDLHRYIVGSRIMNTTFLSTSKDKKVAEFFCGKTEENLAVLCTYHTHNRNNRRTAIQIDRISQVPDEREVLILPFSAFYVESVRRPRDRSQPIEIVLVEDDSIDTEYGF